MKVWIAQDQVAYEAPVFLFVGETSRAAANAIKALFAPPYRVEWEESLASNGDVNGLTGTFEFVMGKSTAHSARFSIEDYEVITE